MQTCSGSQPLFRHLCHTHARTIHARTTLTTVHLQHRRRRHNHHVQISYSGVNPEDKKQVVVFVRNNADVHLRHQDFMALSSQGHYDAVVAAMVIHHQASPAAFFKQAARLLQKGGTLVVAELCQHDQEWAQSACGDLWLGFDPDELISWAELAGLTTAQSQYLAQKNGFQIQVHRFQAGSGL